MVALPPNLNSVHNVFHILILRKYIADPDMSWSTRHLRSKKDWSTRRYQSISWTAKNKRYVPR